MGWLELIRYFTLQRATTSDKAISNVICLISERNKKKGELYLGNSQGLRQSQLRIMVNL